MDDRSFNYAFGATLISIIVAVFGVIGYAIHDEGVTIRQCIDAGRTWSDNDCK